MSEEEVKLIGAWGSPYIRRVETALKLKGIKYEYIEEDLSNKSPLLLQYNPVHKRVPVLVHNGKPIAESLVIIEYIDETWDGYAILPQDPYERAMARLWASFIDDKCMDATWKACWSRGEDEKKAKEEAWELLEKLENELKGKKFFGGERIGLVDIAANFKGYWLGVTQEALGVELVTEEKFPSLCKWMDDFMNCSEVKEFLPPKDRLLDFLRPGIEAMSAASKN
ncbi:Glutathione S-transferase, C-terminal [Dillenia turbinata]|uniref:glutathione transferase n=1 Tax=Dillenia turbinata TaxID=194707 RepID=A0AAN8VZC0_9MAGN